MEQDFANGIIDQLLEVVEDVKRDALIEMKAEIEVLIENGKDAEEVYRIALDRLFPEEKDASELNHG